VTKRAKTSYMVTLGNDALTQTGMSAKPINTVTPAPRKTDVTYDYEENRPPHVFPRPYGVKPRNVRDGLSQAKGYHREDLADPWHRYVPPVPPSQQGGNPNGSKGRIEDDDPSHETSQQPQGTQGTLDAGTDGTDTRRERATNNGACDLCGQVPCADWCGAR